MYMNGLKVARLPSPAEARHSGPYDLLIASSGYETRSVYVADKLSGVIRRGWAAAFDEHQDHSFDENFEWYEAHPEECE